MIIFNKTEIFIDILILLLTKDNTPRPKGHPSQEGI